METASNIIGPAESVLASFMGPPVHVALDYINPVMNAVFDGLFMVLSFASPAVVLVILSALIGVLMLLIWRYTSNQKAIKDVRNQIAAHLLATRLFKDNLAVTFRAQRKIVTQALRLLVHSIKPMIIMFIPFVLLMSQIGYHYEFRPFHPGERIHVVATLKPGLDDAALLGPGSTLKLPEGLSADRFDPCRAIPIRTADWRLTADRPGAFPLVFGQGSDTLELVVHVSDPAQTDADGFVRVSAVRGGTVLDRVLYSADPSIPESSIYESIQVRYQHRTTPILGYKVHWLLSLFVLSIVFALVFKPFMKVHI